MEFYRYFIVNDSTYVYAQDKSEAVVMYAKKYDLSDRDCVTVYEVDPDTIVHNDIRGYDIPLQRYVRDDSRPQFIEVP